MILNSRIRWLAGVTGVISVGSAYMLGAGGNPFTVPWLSFGWYNLGLLVWLALPSLMAFGAILFETQQHLGIRLLQVGSVFASVFLFPLAAIGAFVPGGPWDIVGIALRCLFATTAILILLTDVVLIRTVRGHRKAQRVPIH
jgi:hypothetical protein